MDLRNRQSSCGFVEVEDVLDSRFLMPREKEDNELSFE
jgi:hypothetical protein